MERSYCDKLKKAVGTGDVLTVRRLVKGGVDVNAKLWYDSTLLHEAAIMQQLPIVTLLLQAQADVNARNDDGRTALHIACRSNQVELTKVLLRAGANVNAQTSDRRTSLHVAAWQGNPNVVRHLLVAGARVNIRDGDGWTPLHWAAKQNYLEVAKLLVQRGAVLSCCATKSLRTPLHEAVSQGHIKLCKYLIRNGADVDSKTKTEESVLSLLLKNRTMDNNLLIDATKFLSCASSNFYRDPWVQKYLTMPERNLKNTIKEFSLCLKNIHDTIPCLSQLSRKAIRAQLMIVRKGRTIIGSIRKLPLPKLLGDFLCYDEHFKDEI